MDIATVREVFTVLTRYDVNGCGNICKSTNKNRENNICTSESKAQHHRLHLQANAKTSLDGSSDLAGKRQYFRSAGSAKVDERQRVPRGDSGISPRIPFGEISLLDQPGCRNFNHSWILCLRSGRKAWRRHLSGSCNLPKLRGRHHRILEETARAAAIGVALDH